MKKILSITLSFFVAIIMTTPVTHAAGKENEIIQPYVKIYWSIQATEYRDYPAGVYAPTEIFVTKKVGGFTYSGYLERVSLTRYNTGRSEATYSGTLILNQ